MDGSIFDDETLRLLEALHLLVRRSRAGAGEARRAPRGGLVEFRQHREYSLGDNLRDVDWYAYARLDDLFVKEFERPEGATLVILLDASASMGLPGPEKFVFALRAAAAVSYVALADSAAVRIAAMADAPPRISPAIRRPAEVLAWLEGVDPAGRAAVGGELAAAAATAAAGGPIVVISDLLDEQLPADLAAGPWREAPVTVCQVLAREERLGPAPGPLLLRDAESGGEREVQLDEATRRAYAKAVEHFIEGERTLLARAGLAHCLLDASGTLETAITGPLREAGVLG